MKKRIKKHITDLLKDESGQGTTEYILILVAVVAIAFLFKDWVNSKFQGFIDNLQGKITGFLG